MDCIFCKIGNGEIPVELVHDGEKVAAFNDLAPQAPTHILIIPKAHHANVGELAIADPGVVGELFAVAARLASERGLDGYRTVFNTGESAGQSVFHAPLHLMGGRTFTWPAG